MKSKKITKVSILVLCFLVPVLISMSYFIFRHFAPFGNSSVMTVDLEADSTLIFSLITMIPYYIAQVAFYSHFPKLWGATCWELEALPNESA